MTTIMPSATKNKDNEDNVLILMMITGVLIIIIGTPVVYFATNANENTRQYNTILSGMPFLVGVGMMIYAGINLNKGRDD